MHEKTILLVDDDVFITKLFQYTLKAEGFNKILVANSGLKAIELLKMNKIDIVLLDLNMPIITGLDLLSLIRNNENLKSLKIIVLSADHNEENIRKVEQFNCSSFVRKPCQPEVIVETIEKVLNSEKGFYIY